MYLCASALVTFLASVRWYYAVLLSADVCICVLPPGWGLMYVLCCVWSMSISAGMLESARCLSGLELCGTARACMLITSVECENLPRDWLRISHAELTEAITSDLTAYWEVLSMSTAVAASSHLS